MPSSTFTAGNVQPIAKPALSPKSLAELRLLPDHALQSVDIARLNLLCAEGLHGSERLDVGEALQQVDAMAAAVAHATRRLWRRFRDAPHQFEHSPVYFRMLILTVVLQRDFGVAYDVDWFNRPPDHTDARHLFIHGLLEGRGGTCMNLPVLTIAVGRRLGYPLRLVSCVCHLFVRWDEPGQGPRLNIDATSRGLATHTDDHYREWPIPMSAADRAGDYYLRSLTPREEMAFFYASRSRYWLDWRRWREALEDAYHAARLFPGEPNLAGMHAITTVLLNEAYGLARYDRLAETVIQRGRVRRMAADERWAVRAADDERRRIDSLPRWSSPRPAAAAGAPTHPLATYQYGD
ncbi:MAG: transglutaminase family protein [Planctomycetota bacterium]